MYRNSQWLCSHLRTGYAKLFKNVRENEMKDHNGNWLKCSTDMAVMYKVMEQSKGKIKVINDLMYVYNIDNSLQYDSSYYKKDVKFEKYREKVNKHLSIKKIYCLYIIDKITIEIFNNVHSILNKKDNLYLLCYTKNKCEFKSSDRLIFIDKYDNYIKNSNVLITNNLTSNQKYLVEELGILYFKNINSLVNLKLYIVSNCSLFNNCGYCVRTQELLYDMEEYIIALNPLRGNNFTNINNKNNIYNKRNLLLFDIYKLKNLVKVFNIKNIILPSNHENFITIYDNFKKNSL